MLLNVTVFKQQKTVGYRFTMSVILSFINHSIKTNIGYIVEQSVTIFSLIANEFETFTVMNRIYLAKGYYFTKVVWLIAKNLPN